MAFQGYKNFVKRNATWVPALTGLLENLTWLLPERYSGSEIAVEGVCSLIGLLSLYNDSIIAEDNSEGGEQSRRRGLPWPLWLALVQQIEVLGEVVAGRHGVEEQKYRTVTAIEAIKAIMRLAILKRGKGNILLDGCDFDTERTATPEGSERATQGPQSTQSRESGSTSRREAAQQAMNNLRMRVHTAKKGVNSDEGSDENYLDDLPEWKENAKEPLWWSAVGQRPGDGSFHRDDDEGTTEAGTRPFTETSRMPPPMERAATCLAVGETLYIARPLVYAALLWSLGKKSWYPWLASLALDTTSLSLISMGNRLARGCVAAGNPNADKMAMAVYGLSRAESAEMARRRTLLLFYLIRSPFFDQVASRPLRGVKSVFGALPLFGSVADWAYELLESIQSYHFYTSAS